MRFRSLLMAAGLAVGLALAACGDPVEVEIDKACNNLVKLMGVMEGADNYQIKVGECTTDAKKAREKDGDEKTLEIARCIQSATDRDVALKCIDPGYDPGDAPAPE